VRALSATRWREVFAFDARYFESGSTIAFFYDPVDAGRFDNAAGLVNFGHFDSLWKWLCNYSKAHADRRDLSVTSADSDSSLVEMRPDREGTATAEVLTCVMR
jgi:hypothetical protein